MSDTGREHKSGNAFFGNKDVKYLKKLSRESIEKHTNTSVLYFEVDVEKSKRNFYGEMLVKKFNNPRGISIAGVIELNEGGDNSLEDVPSKILTLKFSCYVAQLRELGIEPKLGDYFATKNRLYFIHNKTILDANSVSVNVDKEALSIRYDCIQSDDETILPGLWNTTDGSTKNAIEGDKQF